MSVISVIFLSGLGFQVIVIAAAWRRFGFGSDELSLANEAAGAVVNVIYAVGTLLYGEKPGLSVMFAALAGFWAWCAWKTWRRRRKGKPSRVLGLVKNLGHRLTVVPVPGGAR